jgi:hypothetical protein
MGILIRGTQVMTPAFGVFGVKNKKEQKMKIGGLIVGNGIGEIVRDGRTLRAMSRAGNFEYPITKGQPYVDEKDKPRVFSYKGCKYMISYFDGCFFPFVVLTQQGWTQKG